MISHNENTNGKTKDQEGEIVDLFQIVRTQKQGVNAIPVTGNLCDEKKKKKPEKYQHVIFPECLKE